MLRETEEPIIRTSYANVLAFFALRSTTGVSRSNAPDLSSPFILFHVSPLRKKVSERARGNYSLEISPLDFSKGEEEEEEEEAAFSRAILRANKS